MNLGKVAATTVNSLIQWLRYHKLSVQHRFLDEMVLLEKFPEMGRFSH